MLLSSTFWTNGVYPTYTLLCSSFRHSYSILSVRTAFLSAVSLHFFPTYESNTNYFRFKIAYSHESAIFYAVWQHTNSLFLQLLDYTIVGKIPSLCVIFLRTGNASETFLGFCMEFFQSAVGKHPDTAETHGSFSPEELIAGIGLFWLPVHQPHSNGTYTPCHSKEGLQSYCQYFLFYLLQLWGKNLLWIHDVFSVLLSFREV